MEELFNFYVYLIESIFGVVGYDYSPYLIFLKIFSFIFSFAFAFFIVWSIVKFNKITGEIKKNLMPKNVDLTKIKSPDIQRNNLENWQKILEKGKSLDENERKFAIIEADTLIDKILFLAGYTGENLGAKLKQVEMGDIESLDDLWEAHKVRNRIAHEVGFKLTSEETVVALARYEKTFKELEYI